MRWPESPEFRGDDTVSATVTNTASDGGVAGSDTIDGGAGNDTISGDALADGPVGSAVGERRRR